MLTQIIKPLIVFTIAIIILWIVTRLLFSKKYKAYFTSFAQEILFVCFVIYMSWMFCATLYPTPMSFYKRSGSGGINLIPFVTTIKEFETAFSLHEVYARPFLDYLLKSTIGNVVLFVPFGFLLPQLSKYKTFMKILVASFLLSCVIETIQFFLRFIGIYRSVDVDDIILNTTGAVLGFFMLAVFIKIYDRPQP
ncbi:MAG: VanZ family protein [Ferruginibacter sp.]